MALSPEQVDKVRLVLASAGWNDVMRPAYMSRANEALKLLALFPSERQGDMARRTDDELRAVIRECEWMLSVWQNELRVADHNRALDELDRQREDGHGAAANP